MTLKRAATFPALLLGILCLAASLALAQPAVVLPRTGLTAEEMAVIVNDDDPLSRRIGDYYRLARQIPAANMIHLRFPPGQTTLSKEAFRKLKREIDHATPAHVQAYAVAWTYPYRVDCMSVTSALAFGFDEGYCSSKCGTTASSAYFNSPSLYPATDHRMRPAMLLAGRDFDQIKLLIDRGVAADRSFPGGRAFLLNTPDKARSVRAIHFEQTAKDLAGVFPIEVLEAGLIANRQDVLFYFTGLPQVPKLDTLAFLPGALADHMTSFGGQLADTSQMSSLRWLEAGAAASYGTVVEPCNFPQKFPMPAVAMFHYARGASAIEAYWKSVAWPGEGVFVGEPLARPFAPLLKEVGPGQFELRVHSPREGRLRFERADSPVGPFKTLAQQLPIRPGDNLLRFSLSATAGGYVRLHW